MHWVLNFSILNWVYLLDIFKENAQGFTDFGKRINGASESKQNIKLCSSYSFHGFSKDLLELVANAGSLWAFFKIILHKIIDHFFQLVKIFFQIAFIFVDNLLSDIKSTFNHFDVLFKSLKDFIDWTVCNVLKYPIRFWGCDHSLNKFQVFFFLLLVQFIFKIVFDFYWIKK